MENSFDEDCKVLRARLKECEAVAVTIIERAKTGPILPSSPSNRGGMIANATLAFHCIEDARMRLGKAIQAADGGISVYPR